LGIVLAKLSLTKIREQDMILFKNAKNRVNYYKIDIYPTLFGDFLIQKEYGATHHSKPTNTLKEYAESNKKALLRVLDLAVDKRSLGYMRAA
jgi:hypothetical protein